MTSNAAALREGGIARWRDGDGAGAVALIERALALPDADTLWHRDLAEICRLEGRLEEALAHGRKAVASRPEDTDAHYNLGIVHYDRGEIEEAIAAEQRAIGLRPDHAGAHMELAEALLLSGEFRAGWKEYEWRFKLPGTPPLTPEAMLGPGKSPWRGEPLETGRLLLVGDQGFGDCIQFMRYIPMAAGRCCNLAIACSPELEPLVAQVAGKARLFREWKDAPAFDCYAALSDLPGIFGTELATIPADVPYLRAEPQRVGYWRRRLKALTPRGYRRIGIVWAGRPTHGNDRNRSMMLAHLTPLAGLDRVVLIALQKGDAGGQVGTYYGAAPLVNLGPEIRDFGDTAAIIETLDVLVTVDTSVAHLAGALARPTMVLLPFASDWRWLRHRSDSPWYPSLRLYRQERPSEWRPLIERLARDLGVD